jgi:hypothetical protein
MPPAGVGVTPVFRSEGRVPERRPMNETIEETIEAIKETIENG